MECKPVRHKASNLWDSFLGLLYLNSARVRLCPGKVKGLNVGGFPTQTNVNGPYAYIWGSRGRRFKSCQPDKGFVRDWRPLNPEFVGTPRR
jgi:hypothetical protein